MEAPPTPGRRRAFGVLAALLLAVALEGLARLGLSLADGRLFSLADGVARRSGVASGSAAADAAHRDLTGGLAPHPFLGYVMDPELVPPAGWPVNDFGFFGTSPTLRRRAPDTLLVGLSGGSVAAWLARRSGRLLAEAIAASPHAGGRRVEIVELALGGFKQPQQLMTVQYLMALGGELDVFVNLDGFNEVALYPAENLRSEVYYAFPRNWHDLMVATASPQELARVGKLTLYRHLRRRWAAALAGWSDHLALLHLGWRLGDAALATRVVKAEAAIAVEPLDEKAYRLTGPPAEKPAGVDDLVALWSRSSRELQGLCARHGILYLHFLQPNQYLEGSKPMGEAERALATPAGSVYGEAARRGYPALVAGGQRLREAGVRFFDLTALYAGIGEPIYTDDCCHVNEEGETRLAGAVAAAIVAALAEATPAE